MASETAWRPQLHFTAPRGWINDPNGLIVHRGRVHLFYQTNPVGSDWGNISWGHAYGTDFITYKHQGIAIPDTAEEASFSGSVVFDRDNTSGLGREGEGPLVALYTGARHANYVEQHQNLAYSNDGGATWTKYPRNPVLPSIQPDVRDPKVFWYAPTSRWVMTLVHANRHEVGFYTSPDLLEWELASLFSGYGCTAGEWECSDLLCFPAAQTVQHVLMVSVAEGLPSGGSGVQTFVGRFDGERFVTEQPPDHVSWLDMGPDFYAAQSWADIPADDGRVLITAWMANRDYAAKTPTGNWRGCHTLARELWLSGERRWQVGQRPVQELLSYRGAVERRSEVALTAGRPLRIDVPDGPLDIELVLGQCGARIELSLLGGAVAILVDMQGEQIELRRRHDGQPFSDCFERTAVAALVPAMEYEIRVVVDNSTVEVFCGEHAPAFSCLAFPGKPAPAINMATSRDCVLPSVSVWSLASK